MRNSKIKNSILGAIIVAGAVAAVPFVSNNKNNNNNNITAPYSSTQTLVQNQEKSDDDELLIWYSWSKGGVQEYALKEIVRVWNESTEVGGVNAGAKKVRIHKLTGNYDGVNSQIKLALRNQSLADLPDMWIGYPDIDASLIDFGKKYDGQSMALNLEKYSEGIGDKIVDSMRDQNSMIAGSEDGAIYSIPFTVSSELMGIDAPLFIWMLQQYDLLGGTVELQEGETIRQILDATDGYKDGQLNSEGTGSYNNDVAKSDQTVYAPWGPEGTTEISLADIDLQALKVGQTEDDLKLIEKLWAPNTGTDLSGSKIVISEETFNSGIAMAEMANEILKAVTPLQGTSEQGILGYDASENNFYTYAQAETDSITNPENGLLYKQGDEVNFKMLEQDSEQWNTSKEIFDFFRDGFENGALWTGNNNILFGSNQFQTHSLPFSVGSTAGATYYATTYDKEAVNPGEMIFTQAPGRLSKEGNKNVQMQQGPHFGAVKQLQGDKIGAPLDEERNQEIANFIDWLIGEDTAEFNTGITSHYVTVETYNDDASAFGLDIAVNKNPFDMDGDGTLEDTKTDAKGNIHADNSVENTSGAIYGIPEGSYIKTPDGMYQDKYSNDWGYWNIPGTSEYVMADSSHGLELFTFDGTKPVDSLSASGSTGTENITPSVYMSQESNYIVGTKATFDEESDYYKEITDPTLQSNGKWNGDTFTQNGFGNFNNAGLIGPSMAFNNIKDSMPAETSKEAVEPTVELELEPYSVDTSGFRSSIGSKIDQLKTDAVNGNEMQTSEEILIDLHNDAVKGGYFTGNIIWVWEWWMTLIVVLLALTVIGLIGFALYWFIFKKRKNNKVNAI